MVSESAIFIKNRDLYHQEFLSRELIEETRIKIHVTSNMRISKNTGSSGNQRKWMDSTGRFIKLNYLGYEDIAEICSCWLFCHIKNLEIKFIKYYPCTIIEDDIELGYGVFSDNYLDDKEEVTFKEILQDNFMSFAISYDEIVDLIETEFNINISKYLDTKACLDAMTRNEDSHWGNFSLLVGEYIETIVFDYGDACMSDCISYPINCDVEVAFRNLKAKPFKLNFEDQINPFCNRMYLNYNEFIESIDTFSEDPEFSRAIVVLLLSLDSSKNIAWEDIV